MNKKKIKKSSCFFVLFASHDLVLCRNPPDARRKNGGKPLIREIPANIPK